jgi:hypothetical protein
MPPKIGPDEGVMWNISGIGCVGAGSDEDGVLFLGFDVWTTSFSPESDGMVVRFVDFGARAFTVGLAAVLS